MNTPNWKAYWQRKAKPWLDRLVVFDRKHSWAKYVAIFVLFALSRLGPSSDTSLYSYIKTRYKRRVIEQEIAVKQARYRADSIRLIELRNNPNHIEHIAREEYLMKAPGETLFLIRYKDDK